MATFFTDFSEYPLGQQPSDWTKRIDTSSGSSWTVEDVDGANALRFVGTSGTRRLLTWDAVPADTADVEIAVLGRYEESAGDDKIRPCARSSADGSGMYLGNTLEDRIALQRILSGSFSSLEEQGITSIAPGERFWLRLRITGTTLRLRFWRDGDAEPDTWQLETTDSSHASGHVGLFAFHEQPLTFFRFAVGTDGDSAPADVDEPEPLRKAAEFQDDFESPADPAIWEDTSPDGSLTTIEQTGDGLVRFAPPANDSANHSGYYSTAERFDLTESFVFGEIAQILTPQGGNTSDCRVEVVSPADPDSDLAFISVVDGSIRGIIAAGGQIVASFPFTPFDPVEHRFWGLRHENGEIHLETSADAETWTRHLSASVPWDLGDIRVRLVGAGYASVPDPGEFHVAGVNAVADPPGQITDLAATADGHQRIDLTWTPATEATEHEVHRSETAGFTPDAGTLIANLGASAASYADEPLDPETTYYYRILAVGDGGETASNEANATTEAVPLDPPDTPTGLNAEAAGTDAIDLTWTPGAGADSHEVHRSTTQGFTPGAATLVATLGAAADVYPDTGLTAATTYYYRIVAVNEDGSAASAEASAFTDAPASAGDDPIFRLTLYEEDDSTVLFDCSTDPGHARPFLEQPGELAESEIDLLRGDSVIGQVNVMILDRRTDPADQRTGWLTARLATGDGESALNGRRARLERITPLGPVLVLDGVTHGVRLDEDLVSYRLEVRDIRERERTRRAFVRADTATVFPRGVLDGYGRRDPGAITRWLVPPTEPLRGPFRTVFGGQGYLDLVPGYWRQGRPTQSGTRVVDPRIAVTETMRGAMRRVTEYGEPREEEIDEGVFVTLRPVRQRYPDVSVLWRPAGGGAWTELRDLRDFPPYPDLVPWTSAHAERATGPEIQGAIWVAMAGDADELPEDGQEIEAVVRYRGEPSEDYPLHIEATAGELLADLYDGAYGDLDDDGAPLAPPIRYDAAAVAALTTSVRARITEPVDSLRDWLGPHLYQPLGAAPAIDTAGRVSPVRYALPPEDTELPEINDAVATPAADWLHRGEDALNLVSVRYLRDYAVPIERDTDGSAAAGDGIAEREIEIVHRHEASIRLLGERDLEIESDLLRAIGGTDGEPLTGDVADETGHLLARERTRQATDRFLFGGQRVMAECLSSATAALEVGDWVLLALSWLPDYGAGTRGMNRLAQITSIRDLDPVTRRIGFQDAGPAAQPVGQPALGTPEARESGVVRVPVESVPAGGEARVSFAVADTEPAPGSGLWTFLDRTLEPAVLETPPQRAGVTVWIRARGEKEGRRPSAWTNPVSVQTPAVPRVRSATVGLADAAAVVAWVPNEFAAGVRVHYAVHGGESDPELTETVDVDATERRVTLSTTVPAGQTVTAEVEPWSGWDGSQVTGDSGERIRAEAWTEAPLPTPAPTLRAEHTGSTSSEATITLTAKSRQGLGVAVFHRQGEPPSGSYTRDPASDTAPTPHEVAVSVPIPAVGYRTLEAYAEDSQGGESSSVTVTVASTGDVTIVQKPYVREDIVSSSGTTGELALTVDDPGGRLTRIEARTRTGLGAWSAYAEISPSGGVYTITVPLDELHLSYIAYRVVWQGEEEVERSEARVVAFDHDDIPDILDVRVSYDGDQATVIVTGDADCASLEWREGTSGSWTSFATSRKGSFVVTASAEAKRTFEVRGVNAGGAPGDAEDVEIDRLRSLEDARGETEQVHPDRPRARLESVSRNVDKERVRLTATTVVPTIPGFEGPDLRWRIREYQGDGSPPAWGSWQTTELPHERDVSREPAVEVIVEAQVENTDNGLIGSAELRAPASNRAIDRTSGRIRGDAEVDTGSIPPPDTQPESLGQFIYEAERGHQADVDLDQIGEIDRVGHHVTGLYTPDTRDVDDPPSAYPIRRVVHEFKTRSAIGAPGSASWGDLETIKPWSSGGGGHATQTFRSSDGEFKRSANVDASSWGPWTTADPYQGARRSFDGLDGDGTIRRNAPLIHLAPALPDISGSTGRIATVSGISAGDLRGQAEAAGQNLAPADAARERSSSVQGFVYFTTPTHAQTGLAAGDRVTYTAMLRAPDSRRVRLMFGWLEGGSLRGSFHRSAYVSSSSWTFASVTPEVCHPDSDRFRMYIETDGGSGTVHFRHLMVARGPRPRRFEHSPFRLERERRLPDHRNQHPVLGANRHRASNDAIFHSISPSSFDVNQHDVQFAWGTVRYEDGGFSGLASDTVYYVYIDDPEYQGGSNYQRTQSPATLTANPGRVYVGFVRTATSDGSGGGSGGGSCVGVGMYLREGLRVEDARPGDEVDVHAGGISGTHPVVLAPEPVEELTYLIEAGTARLVVGHATPLVQPDGSAVRAEQGDGSLVLVDEAGVRTWQRATVTPLGPGLVVPLSLAGGVFAAGESPDARIYSHNPDQIIKE